MPSLSTYTQTGRPLQVTTPLGADELLLVGLSGHEALSQLFELQLDVIAENSTRVKFEELLGRPVSVTLLLPEEEKRYFHGIVRRIGRGGRDETFTDYRLEVVPEFWLLTKTAQSRIFQQMTVPDILRKVLAGLNVTYKLEGTFEARNYCVQYRETDFNFASRLMEEEGIYYFFEHAEGGHTLVVANTPASHRDVPVEATILYDAGVGGEREENRIGQWEKEQELRSGKYIVWDHCFELPHKHLEAEKTVQASVEAGKVAHKLELDANGKLEIYDYPGEYAQRFDGVAPGGGDRAGDLQKIFQDNQRTIAIRMQEEATPTVVITGASDCRQLTAGHRFTLKNHFDADGAYVVTAVQHSARGDTYRSARGAFSYDNSFTCIPFGLPYRPARATPKPRVAGSQTAVVVGPAGEEIFTDKYGRVKVQFHWDREGKNDENSSCWVRVGTLWAGKNWGAVHIPRIGQEVIVDFLEGDPDRPLIVGSVYNADQMPPYALPDNKTQSGIKSRSTTKGEPAHFNEIRFEDKKGEEQLYIHAEKNQDIVVENDETHKIGFEKKDKGDQTIEIFNNRKLVVGGGESEADDGSETTEIFNNQVIKVGTGQGQAKDGSQTLEVYKNQTVKVGTPASNGSQTVEIHKDQSTTIQQGNQKLDIKQGNQTVELGMGNQSVTLKMGNRTVKLNLGKSTEEAMQSIELKVGQSSIKVDQMGVTIKGMMVKIEGQVQTEVKGLMTQIKGDAMLMAKGGITMIN